MISNEYGMSCDLQSAIALYVAEKLFVKVKESDDIESIDDSYTSVSCWDLKPAYRSLSNKAVEYIVEGMISQILYKNFFGCRFAVNAVWSGWAGAMRTRKNRIIRSMFQLH